jgi:hypothetical protein
MAAWKTARHLEDHDGDHRGELRTRSIEEYDASAQETIEIGVRFTYRDRTTGLRHTGYFHRETSRFTGTDPNGLIVTHFQTDEGYVADLPEHTYQD